VLTSGTILDTIEEVGAGYVAKAKLTSSIMGQISRIKKMAQYRQWSLCWKHMAALQ